MLLQMAGKVPSDRQEGRAQKDNADEPDENPSAPRALDFFPLIVKRAVLIHGNASPSVRAWSALV